MAEKKRQYSRALAQKRCLEAIERAILINKSEAERPFVFQVQELVVFGPLVDTDVPTVHGVDILATTARHHRYRNRDEAFHSDSEDFINKYAPFSICSWRFREEFPEKDMTLNTQNGTKKEHFVPQFYMANFSIPGEHGIVYSLEATVINPRPKKMAVSGLCVCDDLYESKYDDKYILHNETEHSFSKYEAKQMLNDYIAGMHIAELAEKYGIGCTNVKKSLEVLEGFDAVRRNDRKSPNRKPNNQKRLSKADMEQRNIEIAQDYKNGAWTFEIAEKYNLSGQQVYHILRRSPDYTPHKENIGSAVQFKKRKRNAEIVADVRANPYMTVGEIMDKYGLSESTTYQVFREAGHPISGGLVRFGPEPPMNIPEFKHSPKVLGLRREALEDTKTPEEIEVRNNDILRDYKAGVKVENIAVRYNVTPRFIAGLIQKRRAHHPLYRKNLRGNAKMKKKLPEEVCEGIAVEYQNGKSVSDIAKDHKIAVGQTYKILHDYGKLSESLTEAETRKATQSRSPITDNVKARNREFAEFARMNTGKNLRDLADIYGISYSTAVNIAKSENIHKRAGVVVP